MKKNIFKLIYPLWFFLAKTWLGNIMIIPLLLLPIPMAILTLSKLIDFPEDKDKIEFIINISIILTMICVPFIALLLDKISNKLKSNYKKYNYKI